ncbi:NTP transferase domain-containing protein [Sphingobacterium chungjuense]|uniref:NTP transferase domain-containing protein n=1 Tax=Sphingobacterium chungjuense TaxID=2675553 RepID=UPI0014072D77|nr:gephyrin-like molybdotransferase Glp [Sphingobacterium chungjuense]
MDNIGVVILAAGSSSRLGYGKQLLRHKGKSLIRHITEEALQLDAAQVVVVLGAEQDAVTQELQDSEVATCVNPDWSSGMGSSLRVGVQHVLEMNANLSAVIISVCDQPFLTTAVFRQLCQTFEESGKGIVTCRYGDDPSQIGVPTLFSRKYADELMQLGEEKGAKVLLQQHQDDVTTIPFLQGNIDIDTPYDTAQLMEYMVSVTEASELILKQVNSLPVVRVPLKSSHGLILAEDVYATEDIPNFVQSSMDGYAIAFSDRSLPLRLVGEMRAGSSTMQYLGAQEVIRVFTGAPVPSGADTVVMQERVEKSGGEIRIVDESLTKGANIRAAGSEVKKGELAVAAGTFLSAAAIGYLAGIGHEQVNVYSAPRVALMMTGDELQSLGKPLAFGEVYESNSIQLMAALRAAGVSNVDAKKVKDDPVALRSAIADALPEADVLILVGGVSVGDYDFVVQSCLASGVSPVFHKIRQKPGKPIFFGYSGSTLVFGLPGNPSSALTCFYRYVLPAIDRMMQRKSSLRETKAVAANDYQKPAGLTHFIKAYYADGRVEALHAQESYRMQSYARSNALMVLPEDSEGHAKGAEVQLILLPDHTWI